MVFVVTAVSHTRLRGPLFNQNAEPQLLQTIRSKGARQRNKGVSLVGLCSLVGLPRLGRQVEMRPGWARDADRKRQIEDLVGGRQQGY